MNNTHDLTIGAFCPKWLFCFLCKASLRRAFIKDSGGEQMSNEVAYE